MTFTNSFIAKPTHSGEASLVFSTAEGSDCIVSEQSSALQDNTEGTGDNERLSNGDGFDSSGDTSGQPEESGKSEIFRKMYYSSTHD